MPNGKGFAQCGECKNLIFVDKPHCKIHNFDFPTIIIGYEILCRDYAPANHYSEKPDNEIINLEQEYLFYYCCQEKRNYKKLEAFIELKQPIYGIHLLDDKQYKWIFEYRNYYKDLWEQKSIILRYNNKKENFIQRKLLKEMFSSYTVTTKNVLYTPRLIDAFVPQNKNSEFINSFIESFIGLEEYWNKKERRVKVVMFGISAFLKRTADSVYEIVQDLHFKDLFTNA